MNDPNDSHTRLPFVKTSDLASAAARADLARRLAPLGFSEQDVIASALQAEADERCGSTKSAGLQFKALIQAPQRISSEFASRATQEIASRAQPAARPSSSEFPNRAAYRGAATDDLPPELLELCRLMDEGVIRRGTPDFLEAQDRIARFRAAPQGVRDLAKAAGA